MQEKPYSKQLIVDNSIESRRQEIKLSEKASNDIPEEETGRSTPYPGRGSPSAKASDCVTLATISDYGIHPETLGKDTRLFTEETEEGPYSPGTCDLEPVSMGRYWSNKSVGYRCRDK